MTIELFNVDGKEFLQRVKCDHIITDPDYVNQPQVSDYLDHCSGNVLLFCDPTKRPEGKSPDEVLFWLKPQSTKWSTKRCNKFVEEILVYKGKVPIFNTIHWSSMTGMFHDGFIEKPNHPYTKPITLIEKLIRMYTNPGDTVFDPFSGSGTTAVACMMSGRKFIGCEIDKDFLNKAKARIDKFQRIHSLEASA